MEGAEVSEIIGKLSIGGRGIFRRLWRENRVTVSLMDA